MNFSASIVSPDAFFLSEMQQGWQLLHLNLFAFDEPCQEVLTVIRFLFPFI
jgi:hypothetical protein